MTKWSHVNIESGEARPGCSVLMLVGHVRRPPVAPELLGLIHREIRVREQLLGRAFDVVEHGDAELALTRR